MRQTANVIGAPIDVITFERAIERISAWSLARESRYVCITNVHSVVTGGQDNDFAEVLAQADMCTPDGAPVAWLMRQQGHAEQERVNGPDLMWQYCAHAEQTGESFFLFGGEQKTLDILQVKLAKEFPRLKIVGAISPPFRALTAQEDAAIVEQINASGAGVVWVSLGCPKQEKWMAAHRGRIQAVMVGVGAAFDYHAGTIVRAPLWMQKNGLEWLHRLCSEPRRLWKRYLVTNTLFVVKAAKQMNSVKRHK
ncbi:MULTISPECIES: WecB/TagA/CpsF family glycosyltransferase [Deefgea]|uniref:WecB/TagA/CpsF family glycosyltransferase n=1 Tax=Deefgea chitinilytica TaxID=570276 RepID=A0ABS2CDY0_9NEIS|nr:MULTISPECIES: WecB/TagA/CpsF family glycosyltransferase [Deefgea]MBM5572355.1 WecB/TagA/CpsF family glycosyltransferase [Deefgea chitinilytica]MBM9889591.1 WecB/TagA/CpsF family glycosyltransferase [Deefgea sp. CFH1-16]